MTRADPLSFEQLVLPHLNSAHNLARWLVKDSTLAEDVTQEAALRALRYFPSYHGGNVRAWFMRIVRNVAYDFLASRSGNPETSFNEGGSGEEGPQALSVPAPDDDPEAALLHSEGVQLLDRALRALPAELRECLVLRELEGLSYKEMAEVMGVPIGTIMSRLWRARQALLGRSAEGMHS